MSAHKRYRFQYQRTVSHRTLNTQTGSAVFLQHRGAINARRRTFHVVLMFPEMISEFSECSELEKPHILPAGEEDRPSRGLAVAQRVESLLPLPLLLNPAESRDRAAGCASPR